MLTCPQVRDALTHSPRPGDAAVVAHLRGCAACRALAAEWRAVDAAVKAFPTPPAARRSRDAFLARLAPATPRRPDRRVRWVEWAVAASLFLGIAGITFFLAEPRPVAARPRVVEEVAEWHLAVAEAETAEARERLVRDRLPALRQAVRSADLPTADRQLAAKMIEGGERLAANTGSQLDEAEQLHGLADEMLALADQSEPASERSAALVKLTEKAAKQAAAKMARQAAAKQKQDEARLARLLEAQEKQAAKMAAVAAKQAAAQEAKIAAKAKKGKKVK